MDAHDRSQQNTWKLFETLSVLMGYIVHEMAVRLLNGAIWVHVVTISYQ